MLSSWVVLSSIVNLYIKVLISLKSKERALVEGFSTNARPSWGHNCLVLLDLRQYIVVVCIWSKGPKNIYKKKIFLKNVLLRHYLNK